MTTTNRKYRDHRDLRLETMLGAADIDTPVDHLTLVPLERIDHSRSVAAQIRDRPWDPETVERYAEDLRNGAAFPAILVSPINPHPSSRYVIIAGLHRHQAHLAAERTHIPAYVVDLAHDASYRIAIADNATHGQPLTTSERIRHSLRLVDKGETVEAAARIVGIPAHQIRKEQAAIAAETRAARIGAIAALQKLAHTTRSRLNTINSDAVFAATIDTITKTGTAGTDAYDLITRINKAPSIGDQMRLLEEHETSIAAKTKKRGKGRPNRTDSQLRKAVFDILDLDTTLAVKHCPAADRARTASYARKAAHILLQTAEEFEQA